MLQRAPHRPVVPTVLVATVRRDVDDDAVRALVQGLGAREAALLDAAADFHGIAGYVHRSLYRAGGERSARVVARSYRATVAANLRGESLLDRVATAFSASDIPWLTFKGPVVAAFAHGGRDLRGYGDVDVLVPRAAFPSAVAALEAAGGSAAVTDWTHHLRHGAGQLSVLFPDGGTVDLHWTLSNDPELRAAFPIAIDELFERAVTRRVGRRDVATLDPVDGLLHLALHACTSGADRLVWLRDIEGWLAELRPDHAATVERSRRWRIALPVAVVLGRCADVLGTPGAGPLAQELAGRDPWASVLRATGWRIPSSPAPSFERLLVRSTRADTPASIAALGSKIRRRAASGHRRGSPPATADTRGRERYLTAVASGAIT